MKYSPPENYCAHCYGEAAKKGRVVQLTDLYEYPVCQLCENRLRNGLVHYSPSNGTEGDIFMERCESCRHWKEDESGLGTCAWGILDRLLDSAWADADSDKCWYQPEELRTRDSDGDSLCPAECLRFTARNDADGPLRDPPPKDCIGQLTFADVLEVPERAPVEASPCV